MTTYGTGTTAAKQTLEDVTGILALGGSKQGEEPISYEPRPPIVEPPVATLPPPGSDTATAVASNWPVDPDEERKRIDALVKEKQEAGETLKKATDLRSGLFTFCLRSHIQQGNIKRATEVLDVWTSQTEAAEREKDLMTILSQLVDDEDLMREVGAEMLARGKLRNHAAVFAVRVELRCDDRRQHTHAVFRYSGSGFITGGFDRENPHSLLV